MTIFLKGIILGFALAAPVGPIGLLVIRRTLTHGWLSGFISGLGAAVADALYASIVGFGLTFISDFLLNQRTTLTIIGSVVLLFMGIRIFINQPPSAPPTLDSNGIIHSFFSTLFLTLTNPLTILVFVALLASLNINDAGYGSLTQLLSGVFLGSATWWLILSSIVSIVRTKLTLVLLIKLNKAAGIALVLCAIGALISLFWQL